MRKSKGSFDQKEGDPPLTTDTPIFPPPRHSLTDSHKPEVPEAEAPLVDENYQSDPSEDDHNTINQTFQFSSKAFASPLAQNEDQQSEQPNLQS